MKKDTVHLTFETTRKTSETLKLLAHSMGKTQPELINEICNDFIDTIEQYAKEELKKKGIDID